VKTFPYFFSVVASTVFLLGWLWPFLPDITIPQGLLGIVLALALRRILYAGLMKYADSRSRKSGS
jgi:NADH:ubiquinone oxidoreductase subunit H